MHVGVERPDLGDVQLAVTGELTMDAPCPVLIERCAPGSRVEVTCRTDVNGGVHESHAVFVADSAGTVDTARDPSVDGSYRGVDPFGLWWSAEAVATGSQGRLGAPVVSRVDVRNDRATVTAEVTRQWLIDGATAQPVDEAGIRGLFCRPAGTGPFPGIVAFGGSGGGLGPAGAWAPVLASRGFAVLAISYFGLPGLPDSLVGIEVEVVERAARWLLSRADVRAPAVTVMGQSRGSELALLAAALLPDVHAAIGIAPSGVLWSGLASTGPVDAPAWTFGGQPLPYAPIGDEAIAASMSTRTEGPVALGPAFAAALRTVDIDHPAMIPVEQIRGEVLLISGTVDSMWPSTTMSELAERRAAASGRPELITHLRYEGAGHLCAGVPGVPVVVETRHSLTGGWYSFGGTRDDNARARIDSWPRILAFLRRAATPALPGSAAPRGHVGCH